MWYVVQTRAKREFEVVEKCRKDVLIPGENVFVMKAERMFKRQGKWELIQDVAFQKYIFAETEDTDDFRMRLKKVRETAKMLGVDGDIVPIGEDEEELLKSLGGEEHIIRHSQGVVEGDRLIVTKGSLKGREGDVIGIDRHHRTVTLGVKLMGHIVPTTVGCEVVKKIPANNDSSS